MDLMKALEIKHRMCASFTNCRNCDFNTKIDCDTYVLKHREEAAKILLDWEKAHPVVTNLDKVLELFPKEISQHLTVLYGCNGVACPNGHTDCNSCSFKNFWSQEYKGREDC